MNDWGVIWTEYHRSASTWRITKEALQATSFGVRLYLCFVMLAFIASAIFLFEDLPGALALVVVTELALAAKMDSLRRVLVLNEYGDPRTSAAPEEGENRRDTRYLMFKKALIANHITASHVQGCRELLDVQIEIAGTNDHPKKKVATFTAGLVTGLAAAVLKAQSPMTMTAAVIGVAFIAFFSYMILAAFPSKLERLREMKYFMALFCRESSSG